MIDHHCYSESADVQASATISRAHIWGVYLFLLLTYYLALPYLGRNKAEFTSYWASNRKPIQPILVGNNHTQRQWHHFLSWSYNSPIFPLYYQKELYIFSTLSPTWTSALLSVQSRLPFVWCSRRGQCTSLAAPWLSHTCLLPQSSPPVGWCIGGQAAAVGPPLWGRYESQPMWERGSTRGWGEVDRSLSIQLAQNKALNLLQLRALSCPTLWIWFACNLNFRDTQYKVDNYLCHSHIQCGLCHSIPR